MGINSVSHCFAMNGNPASPDIIGVQNIVSTYCQTLTQIGLAGPTLFGPLLEQFLAYVRSCKATGQVYNILLILTDGAIHDMDATKDLLYELAMEPCSVIIVGVGYADFSAMEELDGDGGRLCNSRGQPLCRDIVQFVEYNRCQARGDLAEQVLKEVPDQVCDYMEHIGFQVQALAQDVPPPVTM